MKSATTSYAFNFFFTTIFHEKKREFIHILFAKLKNCFCTFEFWEQLKAYVGPDPAPGNFSAKSKKLGK